jgi:predicted PurR-regulated permease PerM
MPPGSSRPFSTPAVRDRLRAVLRITPLEIIKAEHMSDSTPVHKERKPRLIFLIAAVTFACALCGLIIWPFAQPIVTAAILAILFHPLFLRLRALTGNRNWAAFLCLSLLLLVIVTVLGFLAFAIKQEVTTTYDWLKSNTAARDGWTSAFSAWTDKAFDWVGPKVGMSPEDLRSSALTRLNQASAFVLSKLGNFVTGIGSTTIATILTFLSLFYFLREGTQLVERASRLIPLRASQKNRLIEETRSSIQANVVGVLTVAAVQGVLLGVGFWLLSVPSPILWGLVTSICSVIPLFGAALVWIPGVIYLLATGAWVKGLILLGWGTGVVSLSDNFVRPWVISEHLKLSPVILFVALLGGVDLFGPLGIFLGPVIFSTTLSLGSMLRKEVRAPAARPSEHVGPSLEPQNS